MLAFNLANTRLVMATVPAMGRSHFFALYTVVTSLVFGIFPIFWGILLDALGGWGAAWPPWQWNQYSLFYGALATIMMAPWCSEPCLGGPRDDDGCILARIAG